MLKIAVPYDLATIPKLVDFALFFPGIDLFDKAKGNTPVELTDSNGFTAEVIVRTRSIGALATLMSTNLHQFGPMVQRAADPVTLGDVLDNTFPDDPRASSLTTIYTSVTFSGLPNVNPTMMP